MIYTLIKKDENGVVEGVFSFDSISSYSESWSGTVSRNTVENGFPISDHINVNNPEFDVSGIITSYSIYDSENEIVWSEGGFKRVGEFEATNIKHLVARENLKQIFLDRSVITLLETEFNSFEQESVEQKYEELTLGYTQSYENCVITSMGFTYPERSSDAFIVTLKIEQLNIAKVQTTMLTAQEMQKPLTPLRKTSENIGSSSTTTTTDSDGKPVASAVAEKPADPTPPDKVATVPESLQKEFDDATAANKAHTSVIGGYRNGSIGEDVDKVTIVNHGGVYSIDINRNK